MIKDYSHGIFLKYISLTCLKQNFCVCSFRKHMENAYPGNTRCTTYQNAPKAVEQITLWFILAGVH